MVYKKFVRVLFGDNVMSLLRKNIIHMQGYVPGEQPKDNKYIKLNTNENPYSPTPLIKEILKKLDITQLRLYPDPDISELRDCIAKIYGFNKENIFVGNGSDEVLSVITRAFVDPDQTIGTAYPSYVLYKTLAEIVGVSINQYDFDKDYKLDPEMFCNIKDKVFFLANPNSPSGTLISKNDVEKMAENFKGLLVIDEAYADFASENCLELTKKYSNVIVLRTMSKSFSLAGIRLGYAFANEEIIQGMFKVKDSYNVNGLTQKIALAAMQDIEHMKSNVQKIINTRQHVINKLKDLGFYVYPSQSNFIFAQHGKIEGKDLYLALKEQGVLIRYFSMPRVDKGVRITVGTDTDMEIFLKELILIFKNKGL